MPARISCVLRQSTPPRGKNPFRHAYCYECPSIYITNMRGSLILRLYAHEFDRPVRSCTHFRSRWHSFELAPRLAGGHGQHLEKTTVQPFPPKAKGAWWSVICPQRTSKRCWTRRMRIRYDHEQLDSVCAKMEMLEQAHRWCSESIVGQGRYDGAKVVTERCRPNIDCRLYL